MQKRVRLFLLWLYPRRWRERYGDEFLVLLESIQLRWPDLFDIVSGAIDAHLHPDLVSNQGGERMNFGIQRVASLGAFLSILLVVGSLLPFMGLSEDAAEFLIVVAPLALLPVVLALHQQYQPQCPIPSRVVAGIGLTGTLALPILFALSAVPVLGTLLFERTAAPFFLSLVSLSAVWMMLSALLGWRIKVLPLPLVAAGMVSGVAWLVLLSSTLFVEPLPLAVRQLFNLNIPVWVLSYCIWTVGLGVWLWGSAAMSTPVGPISADGD